jgi:hypothetical protein
MSYWNYDDLEIEFNVIVEGDAEKIYHSGLANQELSPTIEIQKFINVLFDEEDTICICRSPSDYFFIKKKDYQGELGKLLAFNPTNPTTKTRKNSDVAKFRSFMIEFDNISIKQQYDVILEIGFPHSTITYSGNKSLHIILTLEQEIESQDNYYLYSKWIQNIFQAKSYRPDPLTKSPSFLTRFPNVTSDDGFYSQKLLSLQGRVNNSDFIEWLNRYSECRPQINKSFIDEELKPERKSIVELVDWYVFEYLKSSYDGIENWFMCPICKEEKRAHYGKRLCVKGLNKYTSCTADKDHNRLLLKKIWSLKSGGRNDNK